MNGSEEGDVLPAAVLSGAPIELEARTVRYSSPNPKKIPTILTNKQYLQARQNRNTIRRLARPPLAHGLGYSIQGTPMGEPSNGMAIIR
jgi:hypothetical protein